MLTLGMRIRAARHGYQPFEDRMLLRIADSQIGWEITCRPLGLIVVTRKGVRDSTHRVWWKSEALKRLLPEIPCIRDWREEDGLRTFIVDDDGVTIA